jgi:hypothetical protein
MSLESCHPPSIPKSQRAYLIFGFDGRESGALPLTRQPAQRDFHLMIPLR